MADTPLDPQDQQEEDLTPQPEGIKPSPVPQTPEQPAEPASIPAEPFAEISMLDQAQAILGATAPSFDFEAQAKAVSDLPSPYTDFAEQVIQLAEDPIGKGILSSLKETISSGDLKERYGKAYDYFLQGPEFNDSAKAAGEAFEKGDPLGVAKGFLSGLSAMTQGYFNLAIGRNKEDAEAAALSNEAEILIGKIRNPQEAARAIELGEVYTEKLDRGESIVPEGQKPEFVVKPSTFDGYLTGLNQGMNLAEAQQFLENLIADEDGTLSSSALRVFATTGLNALPFVTAGNIYIDDETDPDLVARKKALTHKINEVIRDKYYGSQLAGSVAGSLGGFLGAGKLATKMLGTPAVVGNRVIQVPNSLSRWGTYTLYSGGESLEDTRNLSWDERLLDVAENIVKTGVSERVGETSGSYLERIAAQKLSNTALTSALPKTTALARNAAFIAGGTVSETISNQIDRVLAGEAPLPGLGEDVATAAGAVFGMYFIGKGANLFTKPGIENRIFDLAKKNLSNDYGRFIDEVSSDQRLTFNQRKKIIDSYGKNLPTQPLRDLFAAKLAERAAAKNSDVAPQTLKVAQELVQKLEEPALLSGLRAEADKQEAALKAKLSGEPAPVEPAAAAIGTTLVGPAPAPKTEEEMDQDAEKLAKFAFDILTKNPEQGLQVPRTPEIEPLLVKLEKEQRISGEKDEDFYVVKAVYNDKKEFAGDRKFAPDLRAENAIQAGLATLEDLQKELPKEKVDQLREDFTLATSEEEAQKLVQQFTSVETFETAQNEIIMDTLALPELAAKTKAKLDKLNKQIVQLERDFLTVPAAQKAEVEKQLEALKKQQVSLKDEQDSIEKQGLLILKQSAEDSIDREIEEKKISDSQARTISESPVLAINRKGTPSFERLQIYSVDPERAARLLDKNATAEIFGFKNKKKRSQLKKLGAVSEADEVMMTPAEVLVAYRNNKERWLTGPEFSAYPNFANVVLDAWQDSIRLEILEGKKNLNLDRVIFQKLISAIRMYKVRAAREQGIEFAESLDTDMAPKLEAGVLEEGSTGEASKMASEGVSRLDAEDKQYASDLDTQYRKEYQEKVIKGLAEKEPIYQVIFDQLVSPKETGTNPDRVDIANKFKVSLDKVIYLEKILREDYTDALKKQAKSYQAQKEARISLARRPTVREEKELSEKQKAVQTRMKQVFALSSGLRNEKFFLPIMQKNPDGSMEEVDLNKQVRDLEERVQRTNSEQDLNALTDKLFAIQVARLDDATLRGYEQNVRASLKANKATGALNAEWHDKLLKEVEDASENYEASELDFQESEGKPADIFARLSGARQYRRAILDTNDSIGRITRIYEKRESTGASTASPASGSQLAGAAVVGSAAERAAGGPAARRGLRRPGADPYAVTTPDPGIVGRKDPTRSDEAVAEQLGTPLPKKSQTMPGQAAWVFQPAVREKLERATKPLVWAKLDENQKATYARMMLAGNTKNGSHYNGDGPGEGKSRVILAMADTFASMTKPGPVVIVTDISTLTPDWRQNDPGGSIGKDAKEMGIQLNFVGNAEKPLPEKLEDGQIYLTTNHYLEQLAPLITPNTKLFWDEFHLMRNLERKKKGSEKEFEGSWVYYAEQILGKAEKVFMFSGTPFERFDQMVSAFRRLGIFNRGGMTVETLAKRLGFENQQLRGDKEYQMLRATPNKRVLATMPQEEVLDKATRREEIKKEIASTGSKAKLTEADSKKLAQLTEELSGIDRLLGVSAADQRERVRGFLNKLAEANLYSSRTQSLEGVTFEEMFIPLDDKIKRDLNIATAQMGGSERTDTRRKNRLEMAHRYYLERYKCPVGAELALKAIDRGEQVIIFVEYVKKPDIKTGVFDEPSATLIENLLIRARPEIQIAKMYDPKISKQSKSDALRSFQSGKAQVLIATKETAGTGGELDDKLGPEKGGKPRYVIYLSNPLSAISFVQSAGRVWRKLTASKPKVVLIRTNTDADNAVEYLRDAKDLLLGATLKETGEKIGFATTEKVEVAPAAPAAAEEEVEKPAKRLATIKRPIEKKKPSKKATAKELADFKTRLEGWIARNMRAEAKKPTKATITALGGSPKDLLQKIVNREAKEVFNAFKDGDKQKVRDFLTLLSPSFSFGRSVDDVIKDFNDQVYLNKSVVEEPKISEVRIVEEETIVSDKHEDNYKQPKLTEKQQATLEEAEGEFKKIYKGMYKNGVLTFATRKDKRSYNIQFGFTGGRPAAVPGSSDETDVILIDPDFIIQLRDESAGEFQDKLSQVMIEEAPLHIGFFRYMRNVLKVDPIDYLTSLHKEFNQSKPQVIQGSARLYHAWVGRGVFTKEDVQRMVSTFAENPILSGSELHRQIVGMRIFGATTEVLLAPNKEAYNRAKARQDSLFAEIIPNNSTILGKVKEAFRAAETVMASLKGIPKAAYIPADLDKAIGQALKDMTGRNKKFVPTPKPKPEKKAKTLKDYYIEFSENQEELSGLEYRNDLTPEEAKRLGELKRRQSDVYRMITNLESKAEIRTPPEAGTNNPFPPEEPDLFRFSTLKIARLIELADEGQLDTLFMTKVQSDLYGKFLPVGEVLGWINHMSVVGKLHPTEVELLRWGIEQNYDRQNAVYLPDLKQAVLEAAEDMEAVGKAIPSQLFIRDDEAMPEDSPERKAAVEAKKSDKPVELFIVDIKGTPSDTVWAKTPDEATSKFVFRTLRTGSIAFNGKTYTGIDSGAALVDALRAQDPTYKTFARIKPYLQLPPSETDGPEMVISRGGSNWLSRIAEVVPEGIRNQIEAHLTYRKLTNEETRQRAVDYINEMSKRPNGLDKLVRQFLNDTFPRRTPLVIRTAIGLQLSNMLAQNAADGDINAQELLADLSKVLQDRHMIDPGRAIQYLFNGPDLAADSLSYMKVLDSQLQAASELRMEPYKPYFEETAEEIARADYEANNEFIGNKEVQDVVSEIQRFEKLKQTASQELAQLNSELANFIISSENRLNDIFADVVSPLGLPPKTIAEGDSLGVDQKIVDGLAAYLLDILRTGYPEAKDLPEAEKLKTIVLLSPFFTKAKNPDAKIRVLNHHFKNAYASAVAQLLEEKKEDYNVTQKEIDEVKAKLKNARTRGAGRIIADDLDSIVKTKRKQGVVRKEPTSLRELVPDTAKELVNEGKKVKNKALRGKIKQLARYIKSQVMIGRTKEKGGLTRKKTDKPPTAAESLREFYSMFEEGIEFIDDVKLYIKNNYKPEDQAPLTQFVDEVLDRPITLSTFARVLSTLESIGGTNKTVQRLIREPKESITEFKKELQDLFLKNTTMPENLRLKAVEYLSKNLEDLIAAKRKETLEKLKEKFRKSSEKKTRKVRSAIDKILDFTNLGGLTDAEIYQQMHLKLGLPELGEKERKKLNEMVLALPRFPVGKIRNKKIAEINDYVKLIAPLTLSQVAPTYQTANVLNSLGSLGINAGSAANGVLVEGLQAYALATVKKAFGTKEQKLQGIAIKAGIDALKNAWFSEEGLGRKAALEIWKAGNFPTDSVIMKELQQFNIFEAMLREKKATEAGRRGDQVAELTFKLPPMVSPVANFLARWIPQPIKKSGPVQALSEVIKREDREVKINLQAEWIPQLKFLPESLRTPATNIIKTFLPTKLIDLPLSLQEIIKSLPGGSWSADKLAQLQKLPVVGKYFGFLGGITDVPIYPYNSALGSYILSSRLMAASDAFIKFGARKLAEVVEAGYLIAKENPNLTEEEFLEKIALALNRTQDNVERAMKLAMSEAQQFSENGEMTMTPEEILSRVDEILDQNMPQDEFTQKVKERAKLYAERLSFQQEYEGYIGFIAGSIDSVAKHFWVSASIFKFLRTASALANEFLNYFPITSTVRYYGGMGRLLGYAESTKRYYRPPAPPNSYQRDMLRSKMLLGYSASTLLMSVVAAALDDDKENPWLFLHFKGPKDAGQKKSYFSNGGTLRSIQIGKFGEALTIGGVKVADGPVFISWEALFPGATGFLMPVAAMAEAVRYEKRSFAEAAPTILATGAITVGLGVADMSLLTGSRSLLQLISPSSTSQDTVRNFASLTGQLTASYLPFYPKLRDYDALFDGLTGRPRAKLYKDGFASYFLSSFPIVSRFGDPDLDFLGGRVSTEVINTIPLVKRFIKLAVSGSEYDTAEKPTEQQVHDKLMTLFAKHGRRITWDAGTLNDIAQMEMAYQASRGIPVDKSVYQILALTRDLTDDEKYEWVKVAGPMIQADLERLIPELQAAQDVAEFDYILDKKSNVSAIKREVLRAILIEKFSQGIMEGQLP